VELLLWVVDYDDGALSDASFLVGFLGLYLPHFLLPQLMYMYSV